MKSLLIATKNKGKIGDYKQILEKFNIPYTTLSKLNITGEIAETGKTFEENAVIKASFYSRLTGLPCIADDSGFEIDALGGEPGVFARRWPGYEATDEELIQMVISKMAGVPDGKRQAKMVCTVALSDASGKIFSTSNGYLPGFVPQKISGKRMEHFPYRSVLFLPQFNKFFVDITEEEFNSLAFRYKTIEEILPEIQKIIQNS